MQACLVKCSPHPCVQDNCTTQYQPSNPAEVTGRSSAPITKNNVRNREGGGASVLDKTLRQEKDTFIHPEPWNGRNTGGDHHPPAASSVWDSLSVIPCRTSLQLSLSLHGKEGADYILSQHWKP